jgi:hypothetical protein
MIDLDIDKIHTTDSEERTFAGSGNDITNRRRFHKIQRFLI